LAQASKVKLADTNEQDLRLNNGANPVNIGSICPEKRNGARSTEDSVVHFSVGDVDGASDIELSPVPCSFCGSLTECSTVGYDCTVSGARAEAKLPGYTCSSCEVDFADPDMISLFAQAAFAQLEHTNTSAAAAFRGMSQRYSER
jgi:hypothetical protein